MTQPGGSAAINGFLYQLLHHLDWLAGVGLDGVLDGADVKHGRLVLEPRDGGDAQAHGSDFYLVEQYKTRAERTWPLSDVTEVLCDLRRSVPERRPEYGRYRFVTDGRPGRLRPFECFLDRLNGIESPDGLDNETKRKFTGTLFLGDRDFLDHIAVKTRSEVAGSVTAEERELIAHLLRRFDMKFGIDQDELARAVESQLRPYCRNLGDEIGVRKRLIGDLMDCLGAGETRFDRHRLHKLFRCAGLSPDRLQNVRRLARKLEGGMRRRSAYLRYQRENDVRTVPCWPETKPVLAVTGESGVGKSWQLARLMEEGVGAGEVFLFVRGGGAAEEILTSAAREIWQVGLGETSDPTLQAISNFFREKSFKPRSPLFTIAVDDVQSVDVARRLIRQDWLSLGARLVLTVPFTVARSFDSTDSEEIAFYRVDKFSVDELDGLLRKSGQRWADLPEDLKRLLRNPVLAGLYLDLSVSSFQDAPQSEYEIFQAFWDRIAVKCHAGDKGIVTALAALAIQGGGSYPLPREEWGKIGLTSESLAALESVGWLSCLEHGEVEFAHDRLLNWAAAQSLSGKFMRRGLSVEALFACMMVDSVEVGPDSLRRFGYVPMDTLWSLSTAGANTAALGQLVQKMERHRVFGRDGRYLYTHLLPTLGERAIPMLLQRLDTITGNSSGNYRVGLIGEAFATLAGREAADVRPTIDSLLQSQSWDRQSVAVRALAAAPDSGHMDRLWEIHQQRLEAREHSAGRRLQRGHEATFSALRVGVGRYPEWLCDRISQADPGRERVSELAYLLNGLDHPEAGDIWRDVRDVLMAKVADNNPRSLIHGIARFTDHEMKDFVVEHLSYSGEVVSAAALGALAVLDPKEAINRIADIDDEQRVFRNEWLPLLLRADSEQTRVRIRELAASDSRGQHLIEDYFAKRPADLDEETLGFVLRTRERQFLDHIDEITTMDLPWPSFPLRFLGRMCRPGILRRMQDEAGGRLERATTELVCSRLRGNRRAQDHILEAGRRTLVLFAGAGIAALINRELESEHFWGRHGGLNWAWVGGNEDTIERLAVIARRPIACDSAGKPKSDSWQEFHGATIALAALGADEVLVEIFSDPEIVDVPLPLADFRAHRGPMSKRLTEPAIGALRSLETSEQELRCSLVIAWLSNNPEMIPDVRDVLNRVEPESRNALHACIALQALDDRTPEFARLAERLALTETNGRQGVDALIGLGSEGVDGLRRWLDHKGGMEPIAHREIVLHSLYEGAESRNDAIEGAVVQCLKYRGFSHSLYEIAAESDDPTIREMILEDAFAEHSMNVALGAMRGLAKFDARRTEEAVELGLSNHPKIERELCRLLVQVAPESASATLFGAAMSLERDTLYNAIGRALRRVDPTTVADVVLECLGGTETERRMFCRIAEWLPNPEIAEALESLADRDSATAVRRAALHALYRHREEEAIRGLFSEFRKERCVARRWAFFVAILDSADPYLLTEREDSLWLGQILTDDVPFAFEHYACEVIKRRKRKQ